MTDDLPARDVHAAFAAAEAAGRVGIAQKAKPVDARPAHLGEIVVTRIAGQGVETRSKPAAQGEWVVRSRCTATGKEEYLVTAATFSARYEGPHTAPDAQGWREFRPRGRELRFFLVGEREGAFRFTAPWGEEMPARPGDAIVQDPDYRENTYRVAATSFACTYQVVTSPPQG